MTPDIGEVPPRDPRSTTRNDRGVESGAPTLLLRGMAALRLLSVIAVLGALVGAIVMFVIGSVTMVDAIATYFDRDEGDGASARGLAATVEFVGALDEYLFGLLLFVFAVGVAQLFLLDGEERGRMSEHGLPSWLHVRDLLELKIMLVELIVVVLIVQFFRLVLADADQLEWTLLTVPIAIGIFAGVLWVLRAGVGGRDNR